jgi:hypothetical protein
MVEFSTYTQIAYDVADQKGFGDQLRGPGTQETNRRFLSQLAEAYNANDHSEATRSQAESFLEEAVSPP